MSDDRFSLHASLRDGGRHYGARFVRRRELTLIRGRDGNLYPAINGRARRDFLVSPERYKGHLWWQVYRRLNDGRRRFLGRFLHSMEAERCIDDVMHGRRRVSFAGIPFKAKKWGQAKKDADEGPTLYTP